MPSCTEPLLIVTGYRVPLIRRLKTVPYRRGLMRMRYRVPSDPDPSLAFTPNSGIFAFLFSLFSSFYPAKLVAQ
jgi:hypothetical protein